MYFFHLKLSFVHNNKCFSVQNTHFYIKIKIRLKYIKKHVKCEFLHLKICLYIIIPKNMYLILE